METDLPNSRYAPPPITTNRRVPAWLLSLGLHTVLFVCLLLAIRSVDGGSGEIENRSGGIVLVDLKSESTEYLSEGDVLENASDASAASSPPPLAATNDLPPDLPGLDSSLTPITGIGDQLADAIPGADSMIEAPAPTGKIGGAVTTEVFGVKGTGSRFVYVFDRSKSMEGYEGRPLIAARQALLNSLQSLQSNHQFQIIFYNDEVTIFNAGSITSLHNATDENKVLATEFVNSIRGDRGTDHLKALKQAFNLGPDVIFLLTDAEGGFTVAELREAAAANRSGATINAIEFGERRGGDRSLESLARQNGGTYLFKDLRSLRTE